MSKSKKDITKSIQEGYHKKGGTNPPPTKPKPNFTPPPQKKKGQ